jgi:VWFA-related protein
MQVTKFVCAISAALLAGSLSAAAQQAPPTVLTPATSPSSQQIKLDVVVDTKSGDQVTSLPQQDFTILDNKSPRPITSFRVVTSAQEPVSIFLFLDAVNTPYELVASMRTAAENFLKRNGGVLTNPTAIAVLTDGGLQLPSKFSANGMELSDELEHREIGLRQITHSTQWNNADRFTISIKALHQLTAIASRLSGRKIILWISPGFPLSSGPEFSSLSSKAEQEIFGDVTYFSTELRQNKIILYNINPVGTSESMLAANYYKNFVKGVTRYDDAQLADLSIQVLSAQTGGLDIVSDNDVAGMIQKCVADANSWYEITFDPPPADKPNEYHRIDVKLAQPGLIARTRNGYYSNPTAIEPSH